MPTSLQSRALSEQASEGIFVADVDGRLIFVNEAGCRMLGFVRDEIVGKTLLDLVPAEDFPWQEQSRALTLRRGTRVAEWRLRRSDGSWLPAEVSEQVLSDGQWLGIVRGISGRQKRQARNDRSAEQHQGATSIRDAGGAHALHDVSERAWAGHTIRDERHLLEVVFDLIPVGVWIADREGKIILNNRTGNQIWQGTRYVGPERFGEYRAWWVETGKPIAPEEWGISRAIRRGESSRSELIRIQCFDGTFKTVINWAAPIRGDNGEITGAIAVNEDVTSLQNTQEQLRLAVRDREDLLAMVTHDLRSPLASILLLVETMEMGARSVAECDSLRGILSDMRSTVRSMSGLVDDLLALSVEQRGRSLLRLAPARVSNLLGSALAPMRPLFAERSLRFELKCASELPTLNVDAERICRVLTNLLDNALKFTARGGRILLSAESVPGGVRFSIANSGEALPTETLKDMFQPFWQSACKDVRGAGLGLAICRSIMEAHGQTIWAEPAQGERVRVCFVLPQVPSADATALPE